MTKMLSARRLARSISLLLAVTGAGTAGAVDTLALQSPPAMAVDTRPAGQGRDSAAARRPDAGSGAVSGSTTPTAELADSVSDYQPHMLALAGALLMGYIGLRRPRD